MNTPPEDVCTSRLDGGASASRVAVSRKAAARRKPASAATTSRSRTSNILADQRSSLAITKASQQSNRDQSNRVACSERLTARDENLAGPIAAQLINYCPDGVRRPCQASRTWW